MKLTSAQKMLAVIALIVVGAIAVVALLILPKLGELSAMDAELQAAQDQVQQTQTLLAQLQQAKANASVTQAELLRLANQFPDNPELPSLIIELQDVANASGVRFSSITPNEPPAPTPGMAFNEVPLALVLEGKWVDVLDYMRRVNKLTRAIRVTDVALTPPSSQTETIPVEPTIRCELQMRAYVIIASASASAAPAPAPAPSQ